MSVSLRARVVTWSTALLVVALLVFGAWVASSTWRSWIATVDDDLESRLASLTAAVRPAEDDAFDLVVPPDAVSSPERDFYAVWDAQGRLIVAGNDEQLDPLTESPPPPGAVTGQGSRRRTARLGSGVTIMVGRRIDDLGAQLRGLVLVMIGVGLAAAGLTMVGGWWLVGRALAPVTRIGHTARAMVDGDLTARIPMSNVESELEDTARALNDAFDRLYASLDRQRRFSADASHDLRTPLTTMQTELHWALNRPRSADEYRASLEVCRRAATRMESLVASLLALARAEAGVSPRTRCTVAEVVRAVLEDLRPQAQARRIRVTAEQLEGEVTVDAVGLRTALTNLIANAIHYNVDDGAVDVTAGPALDAPDQLEITVRDTGIGLSADDAAQVFDRFYRADPSREHSRGGAGLGLATVAAFAHAHGGRVSVESTLGHGSTFRLRL